MSQYVSPTSFSIEYELKTASDSLVVAAVGPMDKEAAHEECEDGTILRVKFHFVSK